MNLAAVAALALLLSVPSLLGLAEGTIDPDEAGLRLLLAVACAAVAETLLRRFVDAVRPVRAELPPERTRSDA
ncbi:hypothetical protein GCM10028777_25490 [Angustibacter speluncae]